MDLFIFNNSTSMSEGNKYDWINRSLTNFRSTRIDDSSLCSNFMSCASKQTAPDVCLYFCPGFWQLNIIFSTVASSQTFHTLKTSVDNICSFKTDFIYTSIIFSPIQLLNCGFKLCPKHSMPQKWIKLINSCKISVIKKRKTWLHDRWMFVWIESVDEDSKTEKRSSVIVLLTEPQSVLLFTSHTGHLVHV